jgi:RHS repeat-associated protein
VENQYNENGIRVSQTVDGTETRFLIDANQPHAQVLEEYTPGGIIQTSYIHGNDLISQAELNERSFYHVDGLGSIRVLTNGSVLETNRYIYDAYGRVLNQEASVRNIYLFAGEQRDTHLDLDYLRARYLDASSGRFYGRDSFEGFLQNPVTLHRYQYANTNPANFVDPSGLFSLPELTSVNGITNTLATLARASFKRFAAKNIGDSLDLLIFATKGGLALSTALTDPFGLLGGSVENPSSSVNLQAGFSTEIEGKDMKLTIQETFVIGPPRKAEIDIGLGFGGISNGVKVTLDPFNSATPPVSLEGSVNVAFQLFPRFKLGLDGDQPATFGVGVGVGGFGSAISALGPTNLTPKFELVGEIFFGNLALKAQVYPSFQLGIEAGGFSFAGDYGSI